MRRHVFLIETQEESTGGGEEKWQACEEHLLKCQKMVSADERGDKSGRKQGKSKKRNKLMSHLRWWRDFQVGRFGPHKSLCGWICTVWAFALYLSVYLMWCAYVWMFYRCVCLHAKQKQSQRGEGRLWVFVKEMHDTWVGYTHGNISNESSMGQSDRDLQKHPIGLIQ